MAEPTTQTFGQFLVLIGNGADPEVFADPCGVMSRGFNRTSNMNETAVPDCDDPDLAAWIQRSVVSQSAELPVSGVVATESYPTLDAWWRSGATKNVKVELAGLVWTGGAKLQNLNTTGEHGDKVKFTGTIVSDGAFDLVP